MIASVPSASRSTRSALAETAVSEPHTGPMNVTGKPRKGWVTVGLKGLEGDRLRSLAELPRDELLDERAEKDKERPAPESLAPTPNDGAGRPGEV